METVQYSPVRAGWTSSEHESSIRRKSQPSKALIDYIDTELERGMSIEHIKSCLTRLGWANSDIESAINAIKLKISCREEKISSSNEILVAYIEKEIKIEVPPGQITSSLVGAGWSSEEINNAVISYNNKIRKKPELYPFPQHQLC